MAEVASAFVSLMPSFRGGQAAISRQMGPAVVGAGNTQGKRFGGAFLGTLKGIAGPLAAIFAGAAVIDFFRTGVREAAALDTGMREVVTLFGETGDAADRSLAFVKSGVREVSDEFGILQSEITDGVYQAISAGVPKDNVFEFMQVASKSAVGGVTDVATAVDGITTIINAFGLEASDAQAVADSMFTAVKGGKTDFEQLSNAMFNVAPAAAAAGVEFTEVNAALATLTAAGTPTSVATTQVRAALTGLQKPSAELDAIFQSLGYENAQLAIESEGLQFALNAVHDAADGNNGTLQKLLGTQEAVAATNTLAGTRAEAFNQELRNQEDAAGAVNDAFETVNASQERQLEIARTNLANLRADAGALLLPVLGNLAQMFSQHVIPAIKDFAAGFGDITSSISDGSGALSGVVGFLQEMAPIVADLGRRILDVLVPGFRAIWDVISGSLLPAFGEFLTAAQPVAAFILDILGGMVVDILKGVIQFVQGALTVLSGIFQVFTGILTGDWSKAWEGIKNIASGVWDAIKGAFKVFINLGLLKVFRLGLSVIGKIASALWNNLPRLFGRGIGKVGKLVGQGIAAVVRFFRDLPGRAMSAVNSLMARASTFFRNVLTVARNTVRNGFNTIVSFFRQLPGRALSAVQRIITALRNLFTRALNQARAGASAGASNLMTFVRSLPGRILGALGNTGSMLLGAGRSIIQGLINGIRNMAGNVRNAVQNVLQSARNLLPFSPAKEGPFSGRGWTLYSGMSIGEALAQGIARSENEVRAATRELAELVDFNESVDPSVNLTAVRESRSEDRTTFVLDAAGIDRALVEFLRRFIRVQGGGNVQMALGTR